MNIIVPIISLAVVSAFCYYENNVFETTNIKVKYAVKKGVRIIQLSDLHSKEFGENNIRLYNKIMAQKPDMIVATGDLIDSSLKKMDSIIDFLIKLNRDVTVVYIPGNNEGRTGKVNHIITKLKKNGVIALSNEIKTIAIKGNKINILGLAEEKEDSSKIFLKKINRTYGHKNTEFLFKKFEKLEGLRIVLSHYPENFEAVENKNYSRYKFHLMFAGHAHGGQFILPFLGGIFAPGQGLFPKYYRGLYGQRNKLVVSRGLGNSGFPLRLFNRPDIVIVDIENK